MKDPNDRKYANFYERWDWIVTFMVVEDKFVHQVLMMMDKRRNDSIGSMGVHVKGTRIFLEYCADFVDNLSDAELRFVITHEVYHLILHHCTVRMPTEEEDRILHNYASDMAINCLIPQDANRTMPTDKDGNKIGVLPGTFGFPEKLSMEQYIQLLKQKRNENKKKNKGKSGEKGDKSSGGSGSNNKGDENDQGKKGGKGDQDKDGNSIKSFDNHDGWSESEVIKEIVRNAVNKISKDERVWGKLPGDLQAIIMAAQQTYVSWERYLKHYLGQLISPKKIRTMKRPDRRFGYPYAGVKRGYTDRKLVAIDDSGSIGDDELSQFLAEVNRLAEIQPVDLVVFDTTIKQGPMPFNRKHTEFDFKGRGGTDFGDVFRLAEERRYQSVIVLTDGGAGTVEYPTGVRDVLWVLTGPGDPPVEWGDRVRIVPKGTAQEV